jgi:hypothetical protein
VKGSEQSDVFMSFDDKPFEAIIILALTLPDEVIEEIIFSRGQRLLPGTFGQSSL